MKSWLKGGLIGASIILIYNVWTTLIVYLGISVPIFFFVEYPALLFVTIFNWNHVLNGWQLNVIIFLLLPIFYFIIGSIIGWLISKIKSRKQMK